MNNTVSFQVGHNRHVESIVTLFSSSEHLRQWLQEQGFDINQWGKLGKKSIHHLWLELINGDALLQLSPPMRKVQVVQVIIRRKNLILLETAQEFSNGHQRFRNQPPSEKMRIGEDYMDAAIRGLREELGLSQQHIVIHQSTYKRKDIQIESPSYPGLPTQYTFHQIEASVAGLPSDGFWKENLAYKPGDPIKRHYWDWREPHGSLAQDF